MNLLTSEVTAMLSNSEWERAIAHFAAGDLKLYCQWPGLSYLNHLLPNHMRKLTWNIVLGPVVPQSQLQPEFEPLCEFFIWTLCKTAVEVARNTTGIIASLSWRHSPSLTLIDMRTKLLGPICCRIFSNMEITSYNRTTSGFTPSSPHRLLCGKTTFNLLPRPLIFCWIGINVEVQH